MDKLIKKCYGLCPVTDQRGLLGVSKDEDGCAVITVGKNMVIRIRLSDQKQLDSWSTTLVKLSSKVVYNPDDEKYTGVFDNIYIKQWNRFESSLEKIKKKKLKHEIHEILTYRKFDKLMLIVLYKNGSCEDLNAAMERQNENVVGILSENDVIEKAKIISKDDKDYLIIVTKFENKYDICYSVELQGSAITIVPESVKKLKLRRNGPSLLGHCIFDGENENSLITFWSDGYLHSIPLPLQSEKDLENFRENLGTFIGTFKDVDRKSSLEMTAISSNHLAFYASHSLEEGAVLGLYNVKYRMIEAQSIFKMFNKPPRLWLIDHYLIFIMGQRLMCVPFDLPTQTLSALVGSKTLNQKTKDPDDLCVIIPTDVWEEEDENGLDVEMDDCPVKDQLDSMISEGWPESGISEKLLTELMEKKDINAIHWCLRNFIDIPEHVLVKLLSLAMAEPDSSFKKIPADASDSKKSNFLLTLFTVPVNKNNLLNNLRAHLKFEEGLSLLDFFSSSVVLKNDESDANFLTWTIALLDAFYQQFILSRDPKVLESVLALKKEIDSQISLLTDFTKLQPILIRLKNKKQLFKKQGHSKNYYVEKLQLYQ